MTDSISSNDKSGFSGFGNAGRHLVFSLLLIAGVLTVYSRTLQSPFLFDDEGNITENPFIRIETLSWDTFRYVMQASHPCKNRVVANLTFALNYLWGRLDPAGYHIVNITIHLASGLLAALFFSQLLRIGWLKKRYAPFGPWLIWGAALVWVLHPIQINAVTYIVQRMTSLAVFFALLSMNLWLAGRNCWQNRKHAKAVFLWILGIVSWILGMLSKEHVAIVPLLVLIHEFFLFKKGDFRLNWRWIVCLVIIAGFLTFFYLGTSPWLFIISRYEHRDFTLTERLMTQSRVLWHYLSLFYFPVADRFTFIYEYPVSRGLFSPVSTLVSILSWITVICSAWIFRTRWPVFTWMFLCFIAAHLIESSVIPLEMVYEHRMYLPSVFLAFGSALIVADIHSRHLSGKTWHLSILMVVLAILGFATYTRNLDFKDAETVYRADLKKFPKSMRIRLNLVISLFRSGNFADGKVLLKELASEYPWNIPIQINWYAYVDTFGTDDLDTGDNTVLIFQRIRQAVEQGAYDKVNDSVGLRKMAQRFLRIGDYEKALFLIQRLLIDYSHLDSIWFLSGRCYAGMEDWNAALSSFQHAWKINPEDSSILYWLGKSLIQTNRPEEGCRFLKQIVPGLFNQEAVAMSRELIESECMNRNKQ